MTVTDTEGLHVCVVAFCMCLVVCCIFFYKKDFANFCIFCSFFVLGVYWSSCVAPSC